MEDPLKTQVAGSHYKDMVIQPAEFCHANGIPYLEGCAIKYICRHRAKNKAEDIRKAIHFLEILLKLEYWADEPTDAVPTAEAAKAHAALRDMRVGQEVGDGNRECNVQAPDGLCLFCELIAGHASPHRAFDKQTKTVRVWKNETAIPHTKTLDDAFDPNLYNTIYDKPSEPADKPAGVVYPNLASHEWKCHKCGEVVPANVGHLCQIKP